MHRSSSSVAALARRAVLIAALSALPSHAFARATPAGNATAGNTTAGNAPSDAPVTPSTPDIETSPYTFIGEVNADGSLIRCGPSESDYPVLKLAKGARLSVVGKRNDWLKVVPPEGAFCLVPQAFVDKRGDGTTGRIVNSRATVRVGSLLTQQKHRAPKQLEPNTEVKIVGEVDEFYKIAPPEGVFLYVDKRFVDPVLRVGNNGVQVPNPAPAQPADPIVHADPTPTPPADEAPPAPVATTEQPLPPDATPSAGDDPNHFTVKSELPADATKTVADAAAAGEAIRALQEKLSKLEDRYAAAGQQELAKQPIDELLKDYQALIADKQLPPNARKVAEFRAEQLGLRKETLAQFVAAKKTQEEAAAKQRDLKAEQDEIQQRVAQVQTKHFAAIGRLVPSSLQVGKETLYRLVDPANSRLVIYVRAAKAPVAGGLDKFIGVSGQVIQDAATNLTYVQPDAFEAVDPKQVNVKVFADYSPPSLATTNVAGAAEPAGQ